MRIRSSVQSALFQRLCESKRGFPRRGIASVVLALWFFLAGASPAVAGAGPVNCPVTAVCTAESRIGAAAATGATNPRRVNDVDVEMPSDNAALTQKLTKLFRSALLLTIAILGGVIAGIVNTWVARKEGKSWPSALARGAAALAVSIGVMLAVFTFLGLGS